MDVFGCPDHVLFGDRRIPQPHVRFDGVGEQKNVLQHDRDAFAQVAESPVADVDAVDQDVPRIDLVEPREKLGDRRLARSGRTDDRDMLTRLDREREVLQHRLTGDVGEGHVIELDGASRSRKRYGGGGIDDPGCAVEQTEDALSGGYRRLHHRVLGREVADRDEELVHVLDERDQRAEPHGSGDHSAA